MKCSLCQENEAQYECIDCGKKICADCAEFCGLKDSNLCIQRCGNIVVYKCTGIVCKKCADFTLVHTCIECGKSFCNAALDKFIFECPKCLNKVCPDCKQLHISKCNTIFNREEALDRLYKSIASDKKENCHQ
jgi:hypothetical protein